MIVLENVSRLFEDRAVLSDINLKFNPSKVTAIIAPNGSGKTTLISLLSNMMYPTNGRILFQNDFSQKDIFLILSGEKNLYMKNTVLENIYYFATLRGISKKEIESNISKSVELFPVFHKIKNKLCEELSFGQKRLTAIFAAVVSGSKCIIMDEVSEGLDLEHSETVRKMVSSIKEDKVIIITSHDYEFVAETSDRNLFLKNGNIVEEHEKLTKEPLMEVYKRLYGGFKE